MKRNFSVFVIFQLLVIILISWGCKPDKDPEPQNKDTTTTTNPPQVEKGTLLLHLHHFIGEEELYLYNSLMQTEDGKKLKISLAQLYLTDFQLEKLDGTFYKVPDALILKIQDETTYEVGKVPAGNYKGIRFKVGLDPETNKKVPGSEASDLLNRKEMWFGNSAQPEGFIFFNIKGNVDTTRANSSDENALVPFEYRIGTDRNYVQVIMPEYRYTILPNRADFLHFKIDISRIFNGVDISKAAGLSVKTPAENNTPIADQLVKNIATMFNYEM
jgi:hypothetical protein